MFKRAQQIFAALSLVLAPCLFSGVACAADAAVADAPKAAAVSAPAAKAPPVMVRNGAYMTSLYDLNANNNTFTADFWIWFLHDKARELKPLKTLEAVNARDFKASLDTMEEHGNERYHAEKVHGVFNHSWDVKNFPFDRHELKVQLEEGHAEASELMFAGDTANTGFDHGIGLEGWRIDHVAIATGTHTYDSSFGLSDTAGSTYASSVISIFIERDAMGLFWKLLAAVYIAFLVSIMSFVMNPFADGLFNSRVSLLVGMMFAVVINSQRVATTLGQSPSFTLADKIHVLTLLSILCSLGCTLISRHLHTSNRGEYAIRLDRRMAAANFLIFTAINIVMVTLAARAG
jgi:hypothetical protein